ncbi:hypothetical protein PIROE2DRAFT_60295 [Piromyces sp. E2]|nr:hypothetical protein PIROE2DRAFT_60295 [Piromyces sp. E2]|eukprot:OUM64994.1 hypothetical protein PIROE2DRAFT_60295 [Piromyces sp. E2]
MELNLLSMLSESKDLKFYEKLKTKIIEREQDNLNFHDKKKYYESIINEAIVNSNPLSVALIKDGKPSLFSLLINLAIKTNRFEIVKYLTDHEDLKGKIDLNMKDKNGEYPLILLLSKSKNNGDALDLLQYMIRHGANCYIHDSQNNNINISLVTTALINENYNLLKYLLKQSHVLIKDIMKNEENVDPLTHAIYNNDLNKVKQIVTKNENSEIDSDNDHSDDKREIDRNNNKDSYKFTPITLSYLLNEREIFDYLIKNKWPVNELDDYSYSILHFMVLKNDIQMVKYLINNTDVNVNIQKNKMNHSHSALDIAINNCGKEMLFELLKSPTLNINENNKNQEILLFSIIKSERFSLEDKIEIIEYLVQKGLNVNEMDISGKSAIGYIIEFKSIPLIELFIKYGADVNMVDANKNSPLNYAIHVKSEAIVKLLIEHGADVSFVDIFDFSLLVYAIKEQHIPVIEILIEHGADVNFVVKNSGNNGDDQCMFLLAIETNKISIVKCLIEHGAYFDFKDENELVKLMSLLFY